MPSTADIAIIGGGPAGASTAWAIHRAEPGSRIVLVETADHLAAGSTRASLECYRSCWPAECLARQAARSIEVFTHADDYLGEGALAAIHPRQQGYLFCAFSERHAATLRADVEHLHAIGLSHIEYLDSAEAQARFPWVGPRCMAAKFDPQAGWLDSNALVHRCVQASGARVIFGARDVSITTQGGRVTGLIGSFGRIDAPCVVLAAGAHAAGLARTAGVELPVMSRPRQSFTVPRRHQGFPAHSPLLIAGPPFPHVRPEAGDGAIFGWEYGWRAARVSGDSPFPAALAEPIFPPEPLRDPRFPSITLALLARQFGHAPGEGFASPRYLAGLRHNIGYYVYRAPAAAYRTLPDGSHRPYDSERALIDCVPGLEGLVVSAAHAGHGIMTSPAAGEIAASKALGLPLPDASYADFGWDVPWVDFDEAVL